MRLLCLPGMWRIIMELWWGNLILHCALASFDIYMHTLLPHSASSLYLIWKNSDYPVCSSKTHLVSSNYIRFYGDSENRIFQNCTVTDQLSLYNVVINPYDKRDIFCGNFPVQAFAEYRCNFLFFHWQIEAENFLILHCALEEVFWSSMIFVTMRHLEHHIRI